MHCSVQINKETNLTEYLLASVIKKSIETRLNQENTSNQFILVNWRDVS